MTLLSFIIVAIIFFFAGIIFAVSWICEPFLTENDLIEFVKRKTKKQ